MTVCAGRHDQLQAGLQAAGRRFRVEQDRQTFTAGPIPAALDLHAQLLKPALGLPIADADTALGQFFGPVVGLAVPPALRLVDLVDTEDRVQLGAQLLRDLVARGL